MQLFVEQLLNGIAMGSIYALITLGLALVYGVMRILHVAHAAVYTVGSSDRKPAPGVSRRNGILRPAGDSD